MQPSASATGPSGVSFSVDLTTLDASPMPEVSLSTVGIKERGDLQRWIESHPEIVGPDLLLVTTEFDQWQIREKKVADRLDVLFLDSTGSLLVAELKRDEAPDTTELQALKYAAYCSQITFEDVVDQYARFHKASEETARDAVLEHAPALEERELGPIRVRVVAGSFGPSVTHVILWLSDLGLDIGCVQITARRHGETHAVLTARQIIPPPAAEDSLVKRRRKEAQEEKKGALGRRRNSVVVLIEGSAIPKGELISLKLEALTPEQRSAVQEKIAADARYGEAEWLGEGIRAALMWKLDGAAYSCSGLVWKMLDELGFNPGSLPGPEYWMLPNGKSLYEEACALEDGSGAEEPPAAPAVSSNGSEGGASRTAAAPTDEGGGGEVEPAP